MSTTTDRSLATLLRALQSVSDDHDVSRLWASATTILTLLTNPLNVTLLSSQLLSAPAIWYRPNGLRTSIGILGIFNSATVRVLSSQGSAPALNDFDSSRRLSREEWITAIIKGADDRSSRWQHLLALGGLLLGVATPDGQGLSQSVKNTLENAIVKAVNLALRDPASENPLAVKTVAVVLSHAFDLLGDNHKLDLDHDLLLPKLYHSIFFDMEGLNSGYFLSTMDADVVQAASCKFDWSTKSSTYVRVQRVAAGPLFGSLGSMSRLIAFSAENVGNLDLLAIMVQDISAFARCLCVQWRQNKMSEIDITEETTYLSDETLRTSLPLLWRVLKSSMFASIVILRSVLGRVLGDTKLPMDMHPFIAIQTLHILRNLYFISSRVGANTFSQYTFVYLTAIDLLAQYPLQAEAFLQEIRPAEIGSIPQHPLERCYDLYFLNLSEHFPLLLSENTNEDLLVKAATPYLGLGGDQRLLEIFEAAHSVMLAVFTVPNNTNLTNRNIHTYFDSLLKVFPQNLSTRQFRIALKTLIRIATPPNPISELQPLLPSTLLDLVHFRLQSASSEPLRELAPPSTSGSEASEQPALSEQSVLVLTLIDALPFLPIVDLEDWLPVVASSLNAVQSEPMLRACRQRFWEVLSSGEMDVERAAVCVAWWTTGGGRDLVLFGADQAAGPFMSGALTEVSKL